ncbi:MAG: AIM24 family protein [Lachnospiraceae bacterium]|nr:AIM24 family protein [Lachnospiraceae bacterium]
MITTNLLTDSEAKRIVDRNGNFSVLEYTRDLSVSPDTAEAAYFASMMNVRKRQLIAGIVPGAGVVAQRGAMQLMLGDLNAKTDVSGVGDLMKKFVGSKVTGESAIKPLFTGTGTLVLEPTFRYIILEDISTWPEGMVIEDGMFMACDERVNIRISARSTASSVVFGGEGIFNTSLSGQGIAALESSVPRSELVEIRLENDTVKIDGNMALAWSENLKFTVERTTPTLIGSMASGEGFVNVYRGTGRILVAPVQTNRGITVPEKTK